MATIEDAINAQIQRCENKRNPSQNPLNNLELDIWIRVLKNAPRDPTEIKKVIDRKKQKRKAAFSVEEAQPIFIEIQALEWAWAMLIGSDKERENWSKLA